MPEELKLGLATTLSVIAHDDAELLLRASYDGGGVAPPAHLHPAQDERFEVLSGAMRARVDGVEHELVAGTVLEISRGSAHQMWNAGDRPAVVDWRTSPPGRTLDWFRRLSALLSGDSTEDGAALLAEYSDVFVLADA
jgi:mannose-6-phosphate isomerase-like protein (cupin superfamily)